MSTIIQMQCMKHDYFYKLGELGIITDETTKN